MSQLRRSKWDLDKTESAPVVALCFLYLHLHWDLCSCACLSRAADCSSYPIFHLPTDLWSTWVELSFSLGGDAEPWMCLTNFTTALHKTKHDYFITLTVIRLCYSSQRTQLQDYKQQLQEDVWRHFKMLDFFCLKIRLAKLILISQISNRNFGEILRLW